MDMKKFWSSFVVLGIGYIVGICVVVYERIYHRKVVQTHPLYDKYNKNIYYNYKRVFPNILIKKNENNKEQNVLN